jgi:methyltransferase
MGVMELVTGGGLLPAGLVAAIVFGAMLWELRVSHANEHEYRRRGAVGVPDPVYGLMRVAYPGAFLLMALEGLWRSPLAGWTVPAGAVLFVAAKLLKVWAIRALGHRWTYKVLVLPGEPLVTAGPYAFVRHPNYLAVLGELVGMALMMHARVAGPLATVGFAALMWRRVVAEEAALGLAPGPHGARRARGADGPTS